VRSPTSRSPSRRRSTRDPAVHPDGGIFYFEDGGIFYSEGGGVLYFEGVSYFESPEIVIRATRG
jgi:hypothetical protein